MIGSFHGPGGSFGFKLLVLYVFTTFRNMKTRTKKVRRTGKEGAWSSMKKMEKYFSFEKENGEVRESEMSLTLKLNALYVSF